MKNALSFLKTEVEGEKLIAKLIFEVNVANEEKRLNILYNPSHMKLN